MILIFIFIIGLTVGSFLNVVIDRLPRNESISGRSHCEFCHRNLAWYDLIPVLSFITLRGKCRYCHKKLSWQYPLVELLSGITFLIVWIFPPTLSNDWQKIIYLGIFASFIAIFFTDLKDQVISEAVLLTLFLLTLLSLISNISPMNKLLIQFGSGLLVALPILVLYLITKGRGMGFGDVELASVIGFFLGLKNGLIALYIAFIIGGVVGALLLFSRRKKLKSKIAFGPFLIIGAILTLYFLKNYSF